MTDVSAMFVERMLATGPTRLLPKWQWHYAIPFFRRRELANLPQLMETKNKPLKPGLPFFFGDKRLQIAFHFFKTSAPAWAGHYLAHNIRKSIYCFTPLMSDVLNWMICCLVPKMNTCWIGELYKHIELESGWFFLHQVLGNAGPLSVLSILNV